MATALDFTPIVSSLDATSVVLAVVALGVVYITASFTVWAVYKVADFFDELDAIWSHERWGN